MENYHFMGLDSINKCILRKKKNFENKLYIKSNIKQTLKQTSRIDNKKQGTGLTEKVRLNTISRASCSRCNLLKEIKKKK